MASELNNLTENEFEAVVNDLLEEELIPHGRFTPHHTPSGVRDDGWDAAYEGPFPLPNGASHTWRISAKSVKAQKGLKQAPLKDFARYPGEPWIIVTRAFVPEDGRRPLLDEWIAKGAAAVELIDASGVNQLLRRHPGIGRRMGLLDEGANLVFRCRSQVEAERRGRLPLPPSLQALLGPLFRDLCEETSRLLLLVGPVGSGRGMVLDALLLRSPEEDLRTNAWRLDADWLGADLLRSVPQAVEKELPRAPTGLFLLPPHPEAPRIVELLRRIFPQASVVVAVNPGQTEELWRYQHRVHRVPEISPAEAADWLGSAYRERDPAQIADHVRAWGARPGLIDAHFSGDGTARIDGEDEPALALVALSSGLTTAQVAEHLQKLDRGRTRAGEVLDKAVDRGILQVEQGVHRIAGDGLGWRAVRPLLRSRLGDRLRALISQEGPPFGVQAAQKWWRWTDDDAPVLAWIKNFRSEVEGAEAHEFRWALRKLYPLGQVSGAASRAALVIVDDLLLRANTRPELAESIADSRVLDGLALGPLPEEVLPRWLDLERRLRRDVVPAAILEGRTAVGKGLVHPPLGVARARRAFDALERACEARVDRPLVQLICAAAQLWLAPEVDWEWQVGDTFHLQRRTWRWALPELEALRGVAFGLLLRVVQLPELDSRLEGWRAFRAIGGDLRREFQNAEGPARAEEAGQRDPGLSRLAARAVAEACGPRLRELGDLPTAEAWIEALEVEETLRRLAFVPGLPKEEALSALGAVRSDVEWRAWRRLSDPLRGSDWAPLLAEAVRQGEGALRQFSGLSRVNQFGEGAVRLNEEIARELEASGVEPLPFLQRAAAVRASRQGELHPGLLRAWIAADPRRFEPLLLGSGWVSVPTALGPFLLSEAAPTFGAALVGLRSTVHIDGRQLGARLELARLLHDPEKAPAEVVERLTAPLYDLLEPSARAAALYGLAGHPNGAARATVAGVVLHWLIVRSPPVDHRDAEAVLRRLFAGPAGLDALRVFQSPRSLLGFVPASLDPDQPVVAVMAEALLEHLRSSDKLALEVQSLDVVGTWVAPYLLHDPAACIALGLEAARAIRSRGASLPGRWASDRELHWHQAARDEARALAAARALLDRAATLEGEERGTLVWLGAPLLRMLGGSHPALCEELRVALGPEVWGGLPTPVFASAGMPFLVPGPS